MMMQHKIIRLISSVLDSWAVLAYLEDENPGKVMAEIFTNAHEHGTSLLMTTVNAGEVWYIAALSKAQKAELATGDKEFKQLDDQLKIIWLQE